MDEKDKYAAIGCIIFIILLILAPICVVLFDDFYPMNIRVACASFLFGIIYFIPTVIAIFRNHFYSLQIFLLNTFAGMSFIGWIGSLIWATLPTKQNEKASTLIWSLVITYVIFIIIFYFVTLNICNQMIDSSSIY